MPLLCLGLLVACVLSANWRKAMQIEGYTIKAWAADRGLKSHVQIVRELSGEKPINTRAMAVAPAGVRRWFCLLMLDTLGLPSVAHTASQVKARLERTA